ncbi:hypothetical protein OUZ56_003372 [Daphnia magna]|uniref:Uncharacterized protein n=1 Tax=Daphnia magna TaxID=35525 RepID=A0ABR0A8K9_9CRUS|nr:hypothetical protein OUZ56_003372 [Daphnia magna]
MIFQFIFQLGLAQQPLQQYHRYVPVGFDSAMADLDGEQHHVSPIFGPLNRLLIGLQECGFCLFLQDQPADFACKRDQPICTWDGLVLHYRPDQIPADDNIKLTALLSGYVPVIS